MLRLSDIMTRDVITVTPETTIRQAAELLSTRHVSGAPVVSGNTIVGVVSATDLLRFSASTAGGSAEGEEWADIETDPAEEPEHENAPSQSYFADLWPDASADVSERMAAKAGTEWDALDEHSVEEVMTRELWALSPHDEVLAAADLMWHHSIHRVLVIEDGRLVGIVSASDIARAAAEHKLTLRTYVFNRDRDFVAKRRAPHDRRP